MAKKSLKELLALTNLTKSTQKDLLTPLKEAEAQAIIPAKPVNHGKVVNYYVEYEDGTTQLAQGAHAHLVFRFTMEAQKLATMHAFAYYEGPPLEEMSKEKALALISGEKKHGK